MFMRKASTFLERTKNISISVYSFTAQHMWYNGEKYRLQTPKTTGCEWCTDNRNKFKNTKKNV